MSAKSFMVVFTSPDELELGMKVEPRGMLGKRKKKKWRKDSILNKQVDTHT